MPVCSPGATQACTSWCCPYPSAAPSGGQHTSWRTCRWSQRLKCKMVIHFWGKINLNCLYPYVNMSLSKNGPLDSSQQASLQIWRSCFFRNRNVMNSVNPQQFKGLRSTQILNFKNEYDLNTDVKAKFLREDLQWMNFYRLKNKQWKILPDHFQFRAHEVTKNPPTSDGASSSCMVSMTMWVDVYLYLPVQRCCCSHTTAAASALNLQQFKQAMVLHRVHLRYTERTVHRS